MRTDLEDPANPHIIWDDAASDWEKNREASLWNETHRFSDQKALVHRDLSDLYAESVKHYRRWFESKYPDHPWTKLPDEGFLQKIGAASVDGADKQLHPTAAGLLMLGKGHKIRSEFPHYLLDYRDYPDLGDCWMDRIVSYDPDWSGNVLDFFNRVSRKLVRMMKTPFRLVGMVRIDWDPTHDAVQEALVNCLVHADYTDACGIEIISDPYEIVLKNPGTIPVGKEQMLRGGVSEPRNGGMLRMFYLLGYGNGTGSGVPSIFSAWRGAGYLNPTVKEDSFTRVVLKLPLVEKCRIRMEEGTCE